ncbi:hypothetical protein [Radiobacillus deserti]|uniref:Uncharacterized protein n=1 Tax=Radiobacillus deserti TaxID=2594883 RepID=A0A516KJP7_9BACI|nr:hypothetical protein [Radiobacillus deserti]QDP41614.1 hypothetical protein FN924_16415 [Radiobacillus deserti]
MKRIFILCTVIGCLLVGCNMDVKYETMKNPYEKDSENDPSSNHVESAENVKFELYKGRPLKIAVIGTPPEVREEQVTFTEISFEELTKGETIGYDAVFVMKENLVEASKGQYINIYRNSEIPFFFISAKHRIPFI